MTRIVLAFTGGPDTSAAIPWLREHHDAEVVTVTLDLGQGRVLEDVRDRALAKGAIRAHVLDVREELHILSCPYSSLDNNVTTGLISNFLFAPEPILIFCPAQWKVSPKISFLHLLPFGFRAPPSWS